MVYLSNWHSAIHHVVHIDGVTACALVTLDALNAGTIFSLSKLLLLLLLLFEQV